MKTTQTIISLKADNIKRLTAVQITPTGELVVIGGRNGQGKTSVLDAIEMALAGKNSIPGEPIKRGAEKGRIILETQDLTVTRRFTAGGSTVEVTNKEGLAYPSPQAVLDKLCANIAFDPFSFVRAEPKKQFVMLRDLVGLDTTQVDTQIKMTFDTRTAVNRDAKAQGAVVDSLPESGPPRVSIQDLMAELEAREADNRAYDALKAALVAAIEDAADAADVVEAKKTSILELERQLQQAREVLAQHVGTHKERLAAVEAARAKSDAAERKETESIRKRITDAETTNNVAAKVEQRAAEKVKHAALETRAAALTTELDKLNKQRSKMVSDAKFPVEGLGFNAEGVTFNDFPLEQSSSAELLRIGIAIACAMNPGMKVMLIRDGSLLDADSLKLVGEMAEKEGAQVWIERVGDDGKCTVVIEDGAVQGDPEAEVTKPATRPSAKPEAAPLTLE